MNGQLVEIDTHSLELSPTNIAQPLIADFLRSHDVSESSRLLYERTLRQFQKWLEASELQIQRIQQEHLIQYKQYLFDQKLSDLTIGSYLTSVRKLFSWLESRRICPNIAKEIKGPKRYKGFKKDPLSIEQTKEMLSTFDTSTMVGKRDFAIVNLLLRCGLRTIEVCRADVGDLSQKYSKPILKVQGKGKTEKDGFVILSPKAVDAINEYLIARGYSEPNAPLFVSYSKNSQGERLTTRSISQIAKDGIELMLGDGDSSRLTAHSLRHTAAVNYLRKSNDLYATQLFMRHDKPETTQIYLRTIEEEVRFRNSSEMHLDNIF